MDRNYGNVTADVCRVTDVDISQHRMLDHLLFNTVDIRLSAL